MAQAAASCCSCCKVPLKRPVRVPSLHREPRHLPHRSRGRHERVQAFFGGLFGKAPEVKVEVPAIPEDELPFPPDLLDSTYLRGRPLARAYRASEHGWSALDFHRRCDFLGPCLVVGETEGGAVFGGFNPEGFKSSDDYSSSFNAFLFCFIGTDVVTLAKVGGPEAAVFDLARGGPMWGADALVIGTPAAPVMGGMAGPDSPTQGAGDLQQAKSRLGLAYERIPGRYNQASLFGGQLTTARLSEVQVFYSPALAALY